MGTIVIMHKTGRAVKEYEYADDHQTNTENPMVTTEFSIQHNFMPWKIPYLPI